MPRPADPADVPLRVLICDDDAEQADHLAALLTVAGFEAAAFRSGAAALAALDAVRPDACVVDMMMPGMGGAEVARRVREWAGDRPVPVVGVTALPETAARLMARDAGVDLDLFLRKPVDPDQLALVVADLVILAGCPG